MTLVLRAHGVTRAAPGALVNEDAVLVDELHGLFAVADGLAGRPAGEVASATAIDVLGLETVRAPEAQLVALLQDANDVMVRRAEDDPDLHGMAAAVTALRFRAGDDGRPATVDLAHAGDCRCYLLRQGHLTMLTVDHLQLRGRTRVITKVLGRPRDVDPDTASLEVRPGDRWLLCTDGLTKVVGDGAIQDLLEEAGDPLVAAGGLLDTARAAGTPDDVSVVVVDVGRERRQDTPAQR